MPQVKYENVLDLVPLFTGEFRLRRFAQKLAAYLLQEFQKENEDSAIFDILPAVPVQNFGFNLDVNLFARFMGWYLGSDHIMRELTPTKQDIPYKKRSLQFFYNSLLAQFLGVLYFGKGTMAFDYRAIFNSVIYEYGESGSFVQYNAVCLQRRFLEKHLPSKMFQQLEQMVSQEKPKLVAFGHSQVKKLRQEAEQKIYYYSESGNYSVNGRS